MRLQVPGIKVFGGSLDNVKGCTDQVENGTKLSLGKDIEILCLHTPWYAINHAVLSASFISLLCSFQYRRNDHLLSKVDLFTKITSIK
jgi:hypothetical protein